jgi:SNF2 family DNA or RNA helicase
LRLLKPELFSSKHAYANRYCGAKHNGFGWDYKGATNTKELHDKLKASVMVRRLKSEVLTQLPPKRRSIVPMAMDQMSDEYQEAYEEFIEWTESPESNDAAAAMVEIGKLKKLAIAGKLAGCIEWIRQFLDSGEKLVAFCTHTATAEALEEAFGDSAVTIRGATSHKRRQEAVDRFQTDDSCQLFIGNIQAAGVGITLTAASTTVFLELPWTPASLVQAEDRVHRIGQEADSVMAYYLIAEHTIEEDIMEILDNKRKVLDAVLDGKDAEEDSLLKELMDKVREEK